MSPAYSQQQPSIRRATRMLLHPTVLPYRAWVALDVRLDRLAASIRLSGTIAIRHYSGGRAWVSDANTQDYLSVRRLQMQIWAKASTI